MNAGAIVSDAEFIELWRAHQSVTKLANILKCSIRAVNQRRRNLERSHNIQLNAGDHRGEKYSHLSPLPKNPRIGHTLQDGIAIIFSDCHHWPGVVSLAHRAAVKFCAELQPKLVVCNGDAFDGARISRWPHNEMFDARPKVMDELKAVGERLGEIETAAKGATLVWTAGNHDLRYEARLASLVPEFAGVKGFCLKDHFPAWKPTMSLWLNDEIVFKHRFRGGAIPALQNTIYAGKSIFTGHTHNLQVVEFSDYNGDRYGCDSGTLADPFGPQFAYCEDNPRNWRQGFLVATFHKGKMLRPEIVKPFDADHVEFRGQVFKV